MSDGWGYPILLWHQEHRSRAMLINIDERSYLDIQSFGKIFVLCWCFFLHLFWSFTMHSSNILEVFMWGGSNNKRWKACKSKLIQAPCISMDHTYAVHNLYFMRAPLALIAELCLPGRSRSCCPWVMPLLRSIRPIVVAHFNTPLTH